MRPPGPTRVMDQPTAPGPPARSRGVQSDEVMEVRVTLDFACCHCQNPVKVTVQCSGAIPPDTDGTRLVASVSVPCPDCKRISQLYFDPSGTVHAVEPYRAPRPMPEPSVN